VVPRGENVKDYRKQIVFSSAQKRQSAKGMCVERLVGPGGQLALEVLPTPPECALAISAHDKNSLTVSSDPLLSLLFSRLSRPMRASLPWRVVCWRVGGAVTRQNPLTVASCFRPRSRPSSAAVGLNRHGGIRDGQLLPRYRASCGPAKPSPFTQPVGNCHTNLFRSAATPDRRESEFGVLTNVN
jgi:hypothetical protein